MLETGIQFHLPTHSAPSVRELREMTDLCAARGVDQVWITDNLGSRNPFVVLAALASAPIKLGTAVMVQYFRSPIEAAAALATVSELMDGRELSVGLGVGNSTTGQFIETPRAVGFMRQTAEVLTALLSGGAFSPAEYPLVADYFNLKPEASFNLKFPSPGPIRIYGGGSGPLGLKVARAVMDGVMFNGTFFLPQLKLGRIPELLGDKVNDRGTVSRRVANLKISVDADAQVAREFVRPSVVIRLTSMKLSGFLDEDFATLGVDPEKVAVLLEARRAGGRPEESVALVDDAMIDAIFIAGDPEACRAGLASIREEVVAAGFDQVMFSELGPRPEAAIPLLLEQVLGSD